MTYTPIYEFYQNWEAFVDGTSPYRTAKGDREENLITSGTFRFSRYGGCLDGSLSCQYELTTLLSEGDYLLVRTQEDGDPVYAGRITRFDHRFMGPATIHTYGFTKWFNDFADEQELFAGDFARDAIGVLADRIRQNLKPYFRISMVNSGTFAKDDLDGSVVYDVIPPFRSLRTEINRLAVIADDVYYGFLDGGETAMVDFSGSLPLLTYQIIQGQPPKGLRVSIGREASLTGYSKNEDRIINSVHLYGATEGDSWVAEDWESIRRYGAQRRWLQKPDLEDDAQAHRLLDYILTKGSASRNTYEIELMHDERTGQDLNFNENGLPFPWKKRVQLMDFTGASLLSNAPTREMTLTLDVSMKVDLAIGDNTGDINDELEEIFGLQLKEAPFAPQILIKSTARESTAVYNSIQQPPVGFPLGQRTGLGLVLPSITENQYNVNRQLIEVGDSGFSEVSTTKGIPYCELFRLLEWASAGCPEYLEIGGSTTTFCTYVDSNGDRQRWNQQNGIWDWAFRDWQGSLPSYVPFVRKRYRRFLLDEGSLIHCGQTTDHFPTDGTIWLQAALPGTAEPAYYISRQIPHTLSLHLEGTMKGVQDGASAAGYQNNFQWVKSEYQVFSHYAKRYPYSPTYSVGQSDRYPGSGYAYYFTPDGADKAILEGFFYEPVISIEGTLPNPVDLNSDSTTGRPDWDIVDYLATTPYVRALSGSVSGAYVAPTLPESTFTARLDYVKRTISDLTRITPDAHRDPLPSETTVSQSYGLPRYQNWEWLVVDWDDDYVTNWG